MKCLLRFCTLFVTCAILFSLFSVCFATELEDSSASEDAGVSDDVSDDAGVSDDVGSDDFSEPVGGSESDIGSITVEVLPSDDFDDVESSEDAVVDEDVEEDSDSFSGFTASGSISLSSDDPIEVIVVEEEPEFSVRAASDDGVDLVIDDESPVDSPFYGACYVTGTDANLGRVTVYFPSTYKTGYFGVDSNGYLFNVSASSISGYLEGVYNNSATVASFNYPRYRVSSSTGNYTYLYLIPESSNMDIATTNAPRVTAPEMVPYIIVTLLGVIFVCCMKRS